MSVIAFRNRRQSGAQVSSGLFFFRPIEHQLARIRQLDAAGFSHATIGSMTGRSAAEVRRIVEGYA
jgi:hypothetical protein